MKYDVSVVIPIYNMSAHVEKGIASLLGQTCRSMEAVFIDDGSSDDSYKICKKLIEGHENFQLYHTENRGSGPARNTGISHASGEYLYFFDIDDTMEPDALERMVSAARQSACDLLVFGFTASAQGTVTTVSFPDQFVLGDDARASYHQYLTGKTTIQGAPWNKLFRRELVTEGGIEYPPLRRHQDEGFVMRYVAKAQRIQFVPDVLYHHVLNNQTSMWRKYSIDYWQNVDQLCDMMNDILVGFNPKNEEVRRWIGDVYYTRTLDAMKILFNPKWGFTVLQRINRLKERCRHYNKRKVMYGSPHMKNTLLSFIEKNQVLIVYFVFWYRLIARAPKGR